MQGIEHSEQLRALSGASLARVIQVGIADDHPIVRRALRWYLDEHEDIRVVADASSGREAIDLVRTHALDVLLLDFEMPGQSGMDALPMIKANSRHADIAVLMLSGYPEDVYAALFLKKGASGYLNKSCEPAEIAAAIRRVAQGRRWITPLVAELLANAASAPFHDAAHGQLSSRELQVLLKLARGRSTAQVATELSLSPKTVSAVRSVLLRKLDACSNSDLAYYALKHRLLQ